jgi:hypothetical protein
VALLPYGFENQRYCFALITFSPLATLVTLRLSCETLEQMEFWMKSLKVEILHLLLAQEKRQLAQIHSPENELGGEGNERRSHGKEEKKSNLKEGTRGGEGKGDGDAEEEVGDLLPYRHTSVTISSAPLSTFKRSNSTSLTPVRSLLHLFTSPFTSRLSPPSIVLDYFTTPTTLPRSLVISLSSLDNKISSPAPCPSSSTSFVLVSVFENQRYLPLSGWSSSFLLPFTDHPTLSNVIGVKFPFKHLNRSLPPLGCHWLFKLQSRQEDETGEATRQRKKNKQSLFRSSTHTASPSSHQPQPEVLVTTTETEAEAIAQGATVPLVADGNEAMPAIEKKVDDLSPQESDSPPPSPQPTLEVKGLNGFEVDDDYLTTDQEGWVYAASFERFSLHLAENSSHSFRKGRDLVRRRKWIRIARMATATTS